MLALTPVIVAALLSGAEPEPEPEKTLVVRVEAAEVRLPEDGGDVLHGVGLLRRKEAGRAVLVRSGNVWLEASKEVTLIRVNGSGFKIRPGEKGLELEPIPPRGKAERVLIADPERGGSTGDE